MCVAPAQLLPRRAADRLGRSCKGALKALDGEIDTVRAAQVWAEALATPWHGPPVWVHGDVADGNLLGGQGRLRAVIDFGCSAVGDPACDTVIAWTFLSGEGRRVFQSRLPVDRGTYRAPLDGDDGLPGDAHARW